MKMINICGLPHTVVEKPESEMHHNLGHIDYAECLIELRENQSEKMKEQTLWHEAMHGVLYNIGRSDLSDDETLVQNLAVAIWQMADLKEIEGNEVD